MRRVRHCISHAHQEACEPKSPSISSSIDSRSIRWFPRDTMAIAFTITTTATTSTTNNSKRQPDATNTSHGDGTRRAGCGFCYCSLTIVSFLLSIHRTKYSAVRSGYFYIIPTTFDRQIPPTSLRSKQASKQRPQPGSASCHLSRGENE